MDALVGRARLVDALLDHMRQGRSVLLVGAAGTGKTAILRAVMDRAEQSCDRRVPIYCKQASTLKTLLRAVAEQLLLQGAARSTAQVMGPSSFGTRHQAVTPHTLSTLSIRKLRRLVVPRLRSGRYVFLLDHVGPVRGAYADFLDSLVENFSVPIVAAVRSLEPAETGRLWWVGWKFEKVEIPELGPGEARQLIERCLERAGATLLDRDDFVRGLLRITKGNPCTIVRLCEMARAPRYRVGGRTDLRLLWLDLKMRDVQQRIDAEAQIKLVGPIPFTPG